MFPPTLFGVEGFNLLKTPYLDDVALTSINLRVPCIGRFMHWFPRFRLNLGYDPRQSYAIGAANTDNLLPLTADQNIHDHLVAVEVALSKLGHQVGGISRVISDNYLDLEPAFVPVNEPVVLIEKEVEKA